MHSSDYFLNPFIAFGFQNLILQYVKQLFLLLLNLLSGKCTGSSEKRNSQQLLPIHFPCAFQETSIRFSFNCLFSRLQNCKGSFAYSQAAMPFWADSSILLTLWLLLLCCQPNVDDWHSKTSQMVLGTCDMENLFQPLICSVLPSKTSFLETEQSDCYQGPPHSHWLLWRSLMGLSLLFFHVLRSIVAWDTLVSVPQG